MKNDFYIGYLPKMPASIRRIVLPAVGVICVFAIGLGAVFALSQQQFAKSFFEFGNIKEFEGTIQARPVPFLLVEKAELNSGLPTFYRYPLVGEGKHGVANEISAFDGKRVTFKGTLIYRDGLRMIEVVKDSLLASKNNTKQATALDGNAATSLGEMTLHGEIIDSKCYLGVMNPGNKKTHRECAVACLRGGVPALFVVEDLDGNKSELWLLSRTGDSVNDQVLDYVAEPVEINGRVTRDGDQLFFYVNPSIIRRLD